MKEIFLQRSNRQDLSQDQVQAVFDRFQKGSLRKPNRCPSYRSQN